MVKADGFEPDPWLWPSAPQSTRPRVWALWTTIPAGGSWQGKPKRFLSAPLVKKVLERGVFPVPKDLKRSPLAPRMAYRHPLYSERISYACRFNCNPPNELQDWARRYAPVDCLPPARDLREQPPETDTPSTLLPSAGAFGDADPETDTEPSSDSSAEPEEPAPKTPKPADFDDTCSSDVEYSGDLRELYPSDTDAETYEWYKRHRPDTYEEDYRRWRADIEVYESCGYW